MLKIIRAKNTDFAITMKLFRRVIAALNEEDNHDYDRFPDEAYFRKAMEDGRLYILKEAGRVYSFAVISHNVESELFPMSMSISKATDVLEAIGCGDEAIVTIGVFVVDPAYWGKGYGYKMLSFLESNNPRTTFLMAMPIDNARALHFFEKHDYRNYGPIPKIETAHAEPSLLVAKRFMRRGLASFSF